MPVLKDLPDALARCEVVLDIVDGVTGALAHSTLKAQVSHCVNLTVKGLAF
jgi:hypothetical protein